MNQSVTLGGEVRPLILIVDDGTVFRRLAVEILGRVGYQVRVVPSGEQALAVLQQDVPVLVLLNLSLPNLDRQVLAHRLRGRKTPIPIVVVSDLDHPERVPEFLETANLTPPFAVSELINLVQKLYPL